MTERARTFSKSQAMLYGVLCALPFLIAVGASPALRCATALQLMTLGGPTFFVAFLAIIAVSVTLTSCFTASAGWSPVLCAGRMCIST